MVDVILNSLLLTLCLGLLIFVIRFLLWSDWRSSLVGRYLMNFMVTIAGMFIYIFVAQFFGIYPYRDVVNLLVLLLLNYGAWKMVYLIIKYQRREKNHD